MATIPIVLDIEASGFGKGSYPIEIGISRRHGEGWCSLIYPEPDWVHWDAQAESIHGIQRDLLFERGKSPDTITEYLNLNLAGQTVYTDGWNYDYVWLACLYEAAGRVPNFHLADFREIITDRQQELWHATKLQVREDLNIARHRASNDARILQLTWLRTRDAN